MLGSFWRGFEQLRGGGVVEENPLQGPSRVESENGSNVVVQQPEGTTSRVDSAWAPGASRNIMSDGVGSGQRELPVSRPMSPLEATALSPASSTAMPMLGNQDGGVEPFLSRTPGRAGTGNANRRMLNAPCGTPTAFSTPYPAGQNSGEVSMLSDSVGWTGNADYNLGLPGIQDIWGTGTSTTSVYSGPVGRPISSVMSGVTGPQPNPIAQGFDHLLARSEVGSPFCASNVVGSMAPSVRFYETPSAPPCQWYPNSERVRSGAFANDDFSMPRQRIPIVDQPSVGSRSSMNLDPERRQRTKQKPEKFDGNSDWADYLKHFEMVSLWNGWREDEKAVQLSMSLTGTARQAWADSFSDPQASLSYDSLVSALTQRFKPDGHEEAYKAEFRRKTKTKEESFLEFGHRLRRLAIRAFPKINHESREELVVDQFLMGLIDPEMRRHVSLAHPRNVDQAITLATEFETLTQSLKGVMIAKPKQVAAISDPSTASGNNQTTDDLLKTLIELVTKQNQAKSRPQNRPQGNKSQIICYLCDQKGHIARQCPGKPQAQPSEVPVTQNQTTPALK